MPIQLNYCNKYEESVLNNSDIYSKFSNKKIQKYKCHVCGTEYYVFPEVPTTCPRHIVPNLDKNLDKFHDDPIHIDSALYHNEAKKGNSENYYKFEKTEYDYLGKFYDVGLFDIIVIDILSNEYASIITRPLYQLHTVPITFLEYLEKIDSRIIIPYICQQETFGPRKDYPVNIK